MGFFDFLTQSNLERGLNQFKKLEDQNWDLITKHGREMGITSGDQAQGAVSALTMGNCINQYLTHYVRTQLDIHPKWTTQGNFDEMSVPLIAVISSSFRSYFRSTLSEKDKIGFLGLMFQAKQESEERTAVKACVDLIEDMFKSAPFQLLAIAYQPECNRGLDFLCEEHRIFSLKSSHEFPHENFEAFIQNLKGLSKSYYSQYIAEGKINQENNKSTREINLDSIENSNQTQRLKELRDLFDKNLISEEEYEILRRKSLGI